MSSLGGDSTQATPSSLKWKGRNHFNFIAGSSRLRALPVVLHLLPDDINWFAKDGSLFEELKELMRDRVIATTNSGDKDAEVPKTRKRARKEEVCIHGERLQFTYRYRKTLPRYSVLSYADRGHVIDEGEGRGRLGGSPSPSATAGFRHLPLSDSTLLVWVYRFNAEDPYRPVPNEAALQFAPTKAVTRGVNLEGSGQTLDAGTGAGEQGASARDTGLLRWLWGWDGRENGSRVDRSGVGGVRQHFIGSAAWQGRPPELDPGNHEEQDLQRAIRLSLEDSRGGAGQQRANESADVVEIIEETDEIKDGH